MKLNSRLFLFYLLTISFSAISQNKILVFENINTKEIKTIRERKLIQATSNDLSEYEGNFRILNDSMLKINQDVVLLKDLNFIRTFAVKGEIMKITAIIGGIAAGVLIIMAMPPERTDWSNFIEGLALSADVTGAATLFSYGQRNDITFNKNQWRFYIIDVK